MTLIEVLVYKTEIQKDQFIHFSAIFHGYVLDNKRQKIWDTSLDVTYYHISWVRTRQ